MSIHQLYVHLVWTTLDRLPMIDSATRAFLDEFFKKTAARHDSEIIALAILRTHVHMIVRTPPRIDLPRLVQFFKGGSSYAASRLPGNVLGLRWAKEYSATSVSPRQLKQAIQYLENQDRHHPGEAITR
ncbi:MAG TPA: IS200/IS605 family transposase [Gemmatimonadales bacterium]|jgi:REP element-mobilizing transposase RayT